MNGVASVEAMEATTTTQTIRITAGLRPKVFKVETFTKDEALTAIKKRKNLYEITSEAVSDKVRVYGDIDLYAATQEQAKEYDAKIEKALRSVFANLSPCLLTATGDDHANKDKGAWKVSWRFVLPTLYHSQSIVKRFTLEKLEPQIKQALKDDGLEFEAVLDASVYDRAKKMRMVGSSKDKEKRPLRLVCGSLEDSLITYIPTNCTELDDPQPVEATPKPKKTKTQTTADPTTPAARGAELPARQFAFMADLAELVPLPKVDGYDSCCAFIWAYWNEEQSDRMEELINKTCAKSPKYKIADATGKKGADWVRAKIEQERTGAKRVGSVVYWVQTADKVKASALFKKYPRVYIDELFGKSLKPSAVIEYDSRYVQPLPIDDYDTICIESALGTGKTAALMGSQKLKIQGILARRKVNPEALKIGKDGKFETAKEVLDFPRVLFVSGRKSFTNFAVGELKEQGIPFETYSDHTGEQLAKFDRLFIQVESLWRLADGFRSYDCVIVDESETITHQLHSITTNRDNMIDNHVLFERVVSSACKVIVADAFLSDRSFSIVQELRNPAHSVYICNKRQPYKREAIEIQADGKDERQPNTGLFVSRIMAAIKAKRRVVVVWTSKRKGLAFEKDYLQPLKDAGLRWKYYHGDSTKAERADLADVGTAWASLDVLMYTTSISVGISYNPPEEVKQFDECFLWACAASATPRDIAQALLRCRVLKLNRLTYTIDGRTMLPQVRGMDALREYVKEKKQRIQADHPVVQWKSAPKWAEDNYLYNENEVRVSRTEYREVLRYYLRWCGYTIKQEGGSAIDYNLTNIDGAAFDEIPAIDAEEAEAIRRRMQRDEAEPMERLAYRKFKVCSALKEETADEWEDIWGEYMENINAEQHFWNMVREKHSKTAQTAAKEAEVRFLTMSAKHLEQRTTLDKLLKLCGMTHTQEVKTIKGDDFAKLVADGAKLEAEVRAVFGIRKSERKGGSFDVKALHDMLTSVWGVWSGADISTTNDRRITIDGKRVRVYDYEFHPRKLWEQITDRSNDAEEIAETTTKATGCLITDE